MIEQMIQLILGTDKDNPSISVYSSSENESDYHVYLGMALLERVNNGPDSFQYKSLVGRLYNTNIKRATLVEEFGHSLSTIRRWGNAIKSGDITEIERAFSGQGAQKKLTPAIENFIRLEFRRIYPDNRYTYSKEIISRLKDVFQTSFSPESLRTIFNEEKEAFGVPENAASASLVESQGCDLQTDSCSGETDNRKYSISSDTSPTDEPPCYIHHIGLIIALHLINNFGVEQKIVRQWLAEILLGAVNFEQSEQLDFNALEKILGQAVVSSAKYQHVALGRLSRNDEFTAILKDNARFINAGRSRYFYFDPHGVPYSGIKDILKGWCGSVGKICKVSYQDFFHTEDGDPVYFRIDDNYYDMRERFLDVIDFFTKEFLEIPTATFVVDRGIYGKEKMEFINNKGHGLVTWEKGYKKDAWDDDKAVHSFKVQRPKNCLSDIKTWNIQYIRDDNWDKINGYHRLIVRITPPGEKPVTAEVSVLTKR